MKPEVKKYRVSILNETYSIVSDEQELAIIDAARKVDFLMKEITAQGVDQKKAAVLAALKIALDLLQAQHKVMLQEDVLTQCIARIEKEL